MPEKIAPKKNLSARKRTRQAQKRNIRNRIVRTRIKSVIKDVETAVKGANKDVSEKALKTAIKTISSATLKGVVHKNNAARKISKLTKKVNAVSKGGAV